jgi:succinate-acetate transporter protein
MFKKIPKFNNEFYQYFTLITQLGLTVISSILIFTFLFVFLDSRLNSNGILIPVGVILGVLTGVFAAYKLLKRNFEKDQ